MNDKIRTVAGVAAISIGAALMGHGIIEAIRYGKKVTEDANRTMAFIKEMEEIEKAENLRKMG